jgi:hypothetical protein
MENSTIVLGENDEDRIKALLFGRRIVKAEMGPFTRKGTDRWGDPISGRLLLDNGTEILVAPNQGGCACSAGDYELVKLATVDNAISDVKLINDPDGDDYGSDASGKYAIHVVADAHEMEVAVMEGSDGNGYYGRGYELIVTVPNGETAF